MVKYEVNGHIIEFENEPTEQDIDDAASTLGPLQNTPQTAPNNVERPINPIQIAVETATDPFLAPLGQSSQQRKAQEQYGPARSKMLDADPMSPIKFLPETPDFKGINPKSVGRGIRDIAFDALVLPSAQKLPKGILKGTDKNITSVLRRLAGRESTDIKQGRSLTSKYSPDFLSKSKGKPEFLQTEISPKAADVASQRVKSMEPEALREIGVSPESTEIAQNVKGKFGLSEFPTKSKADEFFDTVINSAPPESRITPKNLSSVLDEISSHTNPREFESVRRAIKRPQSSEEALFGLTPGKLKDLTPDEYKNLRAFLNDMTDSGNNPFFQRLKNALDMDAEAVIPQLSEAKGVFQVSRELPKAEAYLDKTRLPNEMASKLKTASQPENVNLRQSLNRLLGPEGEKIIDESNASRLSQEMYRQSDARSPGLGNKDFFLDLMRVPGRSMLRNYEKGRASVRTLFKGKSKKN